MWVAQIHDKILTINDTGEFYFNDKQLHFLVMGIVGMLLVFVIHPLFKLLANTNHIMVITWIYTFTVMTVVAFAIEIGQWYSGTGLMELEDVTSGLKGFLVMFAIFLVIRGIYHLVVRAVDGPDESKH